MLLFTIFADGKVFQPPKMGFECGCGGSVPRPPMFCKCFRDGACATLRGFYVRGVRKHIRMVYRRAERHRRGWNKRPKFGRLYVPAAPAAGLW